MSRSRWSRPADLRCRRRPQPRPRPPCSVPATVGNGDRGDGGGAGSDGAAQEGPAQRDEGAYIPGLLLPDAPATHSASDASGPEPAPSPDPADRRAWKRHIAYRRRAREEATRAAYRWLLTADDPRQILEEMLADEYIRGCDRAFLGDLLLGACRHAEQSRARLAPLLSRPVAQLTPVVHGILLVAAFELAEQDTPAPVIINEAVALARRYGGEDNHRFVNNVLDQLARQLRADDGAAGR